MVWGIASADNQQDTVEDFRDALGVTFPILWDDGGDVYDEYELRSRYPTAVFPKDYIIDTDGKVAYVNNGYEPDEMIPVIERALSTP